MNIPVKFDVYGHLETRINEPFKNVRESDQCLFSTERRNLL